MHSCSQGRREESRAREADRSKRAPTTLGQQIYPRNGGHPRHFLGISWAMPLSVREVLQLLAQKTSSNMYYV